MDAWRPEVRLHCKPLEIAQNLYAHGEITKEEFESIEGDIA